MKTLYSSIVFIMLVLFTSVSFANAIVPTIADAVCNPVKSRCVFPVGNTLPLIALGAAALVASDWNGQACDKEPLRKVSKAGSNVTFEVAGCEYEAHKQIYTVK